MRNCTPARKKFIVRILYADGPCVQCITVQICPPWRQLPVGVRYNNLMQRKVFWLSFSAIGIVADLVLPFWWALFATIPAGMLAWWIAYRSDWF